MFPLLKVLPYPFGLDMAGNRVSGLALTAVVKYWTGAGEIISDTVYRHPRPPPVYDIPHGESRLAGHAELVVVSDFQAIS